MPRSRTVHDDIIGAGSKLICGSLAKNSADTHWPQRRGGGAEKATTSTASETRRSWSALTNARRAVGRPWLVKQEISLWRLGTCLRAIAY